jgi:hypothetical protein
MPAWKLLCLSIFGGIFVAGIWPPENAWMIGIGLVGFTLTLIVKD